MLNVHGADLTLKPITLMMERQMKHSRPLVDDLLDFSRITLGKSRCARSAFSLQPLLRVQSR